VFNLSVSVANNFSLLKLNINRTLRGSAGLFAPMWQLLCPSSLQKSKGFNQGWIQVPSATVSKKGLIAKIVINSTKSHH